MLLEAVSQISLSPIELRDWMNQATTQEVFRALTQEREEWARRLVEGDTLDINGKEISQTAHAVGVVRGLDCLLIGVEEMLRLQWDEAQARMNAEMMADDNHNR